MVVSPVLMQYEVDSKSKLAVVASSAKSAVSVGATNPGFVPTTLLEVSPISIVPDNAGKSK